MNKRQRKKFEKKTHTGRYRQDGFEVKIKPEMDINETYDTFGKLCQRLGFDWGGNPSAGGAFITRHGKTCTEDDRQLIIEWAKTTSYEVLVGPLVDAWHGWN